MAQQENSALPHILRELAPDFGAESPDASGPGATNGDHRSAAPFPATNCTTTALGGKEDSGGVKHASSATVENGDPQQSHTAPYQATRRQIRTPRQVSVIPTTVATTEFIGAENSDLPGSAPVAAIASGELARRSGTVTTIHDNNTNNGRAQSSSSFSGPSSVEVPATRGAPPTRIVSSSSSSSSGGNNVTVSSGGGGGSGRSGATTAGGVPPPPHCSEQLPYSTSAAAAAAATTSTGATATAAAATATSASAAATTATAVNRSLQEPSSPATTTNPGAPSPDVDIAPPAEDPTTTTTTTNSTTNTNTTTNNNNDDDDDEDDDEKYGGRVRVLCRFRRFLDAESEWAARRIGWLNFDGSGAGGGGGGGETGEAGEGLDMVAVRVGGVWSRRKFDRVFRPGVDQGEVYEQVERVAHGVAQGFNGTIFAYGQTGSGKTFTMGGSASTIPPSPPRPPPPPPQNSNSSEPWNPIAAEPTSPPLPPPVSPPQQQPTVSEPPPLSPATLRMPPPPLPGKSGLRRPATTTASGAGALAPALGSEAGVIPRAVATVLADASARREQGWEFVLTATYVEIYNERIRDLLSPASDNLKVSERPGRGVEVAGAREVRVSTLEEAVAVLREGAKHRMTAATLMNQASSRSHSIFMLRLDQRDVVRDCKVSGRLTLVDLAGSERAGKTGAEGRRLEEANSINVSLHTLGRVIRALSENGPHVPFRDSKLTRLLQESLGGNSRTVLIICCSPEEAQSQETLSTLKFGECAKRVTTFASANVVAAPDEVAAQLAELRAEVVRLKRQLHVMHLREAKSRETMALMSAGRRSSRSSMNNGDRGARGGSATRRKWGSSAFNVAPGDVGVSSGDDSWGGRTTPRGWEQNASSWNSGTAGLPSPSTPGWKSRAAAAAAAHREQQSPLGASSVSPAMSPDASATASNCASVGSAAAAAAAAEAAAAASTSKGGGERRRGGGGGGSSVAPTVARASSAKGGSGRRNDGLGRERERGRFLWSEEEQERDAALAAAAATSSNGVGVAAVGVRSGGGGGDGDRTPAEDSGSNDIYRHWEQVEEEGGGGASWRRRRVARQDSLSESGAEAEEGRLPTPARDGIRAEGGGEGEAMDAGRNHRRFGFQPKGKGGTPGRRRHHQGYKRALQQPWSQRGGGEDEEEDDQQQQQQRMASPNLPPSLIPRRGSSIPRLSVSRGGGVGLAAAVVGVSAGTSADVSGDDESGGFWTFPREGMRNVLEPRGSGLARKEAVLLAGAGMRSPPVRQIRAVAEGGGKVHVVDRAMSSSEGEGVDRHELRVALVRIKRLQKSWEERCSAFEKLLQLKDLRIESLMLPHRIGSLSGYPGEAATVSKNASSVKTKTATSDGRGGFSKPRGVAGGDEGGGGGGGERVGEGRGATPKKTKGAERVLVCRSARPPALRPLRHPPP